MVDKNENIKVRKDVSESFGNDPCSQWHYILAIGINASIHITIGLFIAINSVFNSILLLMSFICFIYPSYFAADTLWSMRSDVSAILTKETKINRKYYANIIRTDISKKQLFSLTVNVAVYTEKNSVIFETIRQSIQEIERYRSVSGKEANIVVSDDGLAQLLGGYCTQKNIAEILLKSVISPQKLSKEEQKAVKRIQYYRKNRIGFVVRPEKNRQGKFKKASNLNYTFRLGQISRGVSLDTLIATNGEFELGYAEGNIVTHEIILLLDKDSGVPNKIIEAVVPEFVADSKLAYAQCATNAANSADNYFSRAVGFFTNNLFHNIFPCKALQGFFVPLVGHNAFLRKCHLEKSGLWSENKVSEDFDKAISFYNIGFHGKYIHFSGLEFSEFVSRTFTEETGKQFRYSYGVIEMLLEGTVKIGKTRGCDLLYMLLYFCSFINMILLFPIILIESYFIEASALWAGILLTVVILILFPYIRNLSIRRRLPKEQHVTLFQSIVIGISFLGHAYSMLGGLCKYFIDKIRSNPPTFPSTSVDTIEYSFVDGLKILGKYFRKNIGIVIIMGLCLERGFFILRHIP